MGYILYRDRSKPTETDEEMWDSPFNTYLTRVRLRPNTCTCDLW
ncbi:hypothetical protein [Streptomyces carpinensis]|uniref:Uncharacterized protein n=1 Tax=Streptomyces carpinensis TaxID=66369 RepID=A0ABV1W8W1_9ACTN|nr:hypothetical protein [Streptomyces carpinensis]